MKSVLATIVSLSIFVVVQSQLWSGAIQEGVRLEQRDRALARRNQALERNIARKEERIDDLKSDVIRERSLVDRFFGRDGYDNRGYGRDGYDNRGYGRDGYDNRGYGRDGYDRRGYNEYGLGRDGYDLDGYDEDGYHRDGYNRYDYGSHLYGDRYPTVGGRRY